MENEDFMEHDGFVFATITPRQVLKDAFAAKILPDGQVWIDMLDHRNLLSHTYNLAKFEEAVKAVHEHISTPSISFMNSCKGRR